MKAAVYYETGGPEVFRYEERPDPACHARGLLVRVEAISIEGGDVLNRAGGELTSRPHIVGYQCAGTIVEAGSEVSDFAPGQRVVVTIPSGSHASLVSVPARSVWLVPEGMDVREAACVPIAFGTADDCLFEFGHLKAGEFALIQGAGGGVGLAAVQLAKRAGATVLGTASSAEKLARLREFGLDHGINYREQDLVQEVRNLTGGHGADLVVDPVGTTLAQSLACLAYRGRAVLVGNAGRGDTHVDVRSLMTGNQSLTGVYLGAEMATERVRTMIAQHLKDVTAGTLTVVIDRTFPLSEAAAAHAYIESRSAFGRVVLVP
ncbi:MAG: quinone oxidoreductase family protein [Dehalococcoidia bacterium]